MTKEEFFEAFHDGYIECMLWANVIRDDGAYGDQDADDLSEEAVHEMRHDCQDFVDAEFERMKDLDPAQCGHDFALTRNRHGAGFWDRGLGELGDDLTKAAHAYGSQDLYVGDDGKLYCGG